MLALLGGVVDLENPKEPPKEFGRDLGVGSWLLLVLEVPVDHAVSSDVAGATLQIGLVHNVVPVCDRGRVFDESLGDAPFQERSLEPWLLLGEAMELRKRLVLAVASFVDCFGGLLPHFGAPVCFVLRTVGPTLVVRQGPSTNYNSVVRHLRQRFVASAETPPPDEGIAILATLACMGMPNLFNSGHAVRPSVDLLACWDHYAASLDNQLGMTAAPGAGEGNDRSGPSAAHCNPVERYAAS